MALAAAATGKGDAAVGQRTGPAPGRGPARRLLRGQSGSSGENKTKKKRKETAELIAALRSLWSKNCE